MKAQYFYCSWAYAISHEVSPAHEDPRSLLAQAPDLKGRMGKLAQEPAE